MTRLIRVAYGPFQLGNLERGAIEEVPAKVLREQLGGGFAVARSAQRGPATHNFALSCFAMMADFSSQSTANIPVIGCILTVPTPAFRPRERFSEAMNNRRQLWRNW